MLVKDIKAALAAKGMTPAKIVNKYDDYDVAVCSIGGNAGSSSAMVYCAFPISPEGEEIPCQTVLYGRVSDSAVGKVLVPDLDISEVASALQGRSFKLLKGSLDQDCVTMIDFGSLRKHVFHAKASDVAFTGSDRYIIIDIFGEKGINYNYGFRLFVRANPGEDGESPAERILIDLRDNGIIGKAECDEELLYLKI
jgi:hypothetical protein